ncbi:MAG TPA: hypothetical protein VG097_08165 [Gemmata sp.]|nr:hypothetical protein [Gemmata sp.]
MKQNAHQETPLFLDGHTKTAVKIYEQAANYYWGDNPDSRDAHGETERELVAIGRNGNAALVWSVD